MTCLSLATKRLALGHRVNAVLLHACAAQDNHACPSACNLTGKAKLHKAKLEIQTFRLAEIELSQ